MTKSTKCLGYERFVTTATTNTPPRALVLQRWQKYFTGDTSWKWSLTKVDEVFNEGRWGCLILYTRCVDSITLTFRLIKSHRTFQWFLLFELRICSLIISGHLHQMFCLLHRLLSLLEMFHLFPTLVNDGWYVCYVLDEKSPVRSRILHFQALKPGPSICSVESFFFLNPLRPCNPIAYYCDLMQLRNESSVGFPI